MPSTLLVGDDLAGPAPQRAAVPPVQIRALYRAVWRWHFYAGLLVLPFLAWLAVTGSLYLFKPEIERAWYGSWMRVAAPAATPNAGRIVATVEGETGVTVTQIITPRDPGESWRMTLSTKAHGQQMAFVDPNSGHVLGVTRPGGVMGLVKDLHSLIITGPIGNGLIEIAAGWAILLVATGLYLWWPRGEAPALALRGSPAKRLFWRDLHASLGLIAAAVILFLATTGMPWSGVWGKYVQAWVTAHDLGKPKPPAGAAGEHAGHAGMEGMASMASMPWAMQKMPMPMGSMSGHAIGPDKAIAAARGAGLAAPWTLTLPKMAGMPYLFSATARGAEEERVLYVDGGTGRVMQDTPYARYGMGAKAIDWGVQTHQGLEYGNANRFVMLAGCVGLLLLAMSAPVMWWKRRPAGRLGAPPRPEPDKRVKGLLVVMLVGGLIFPLTGATMLVALLVDWVAMRRAAAG